jgi:hypothetical protein
VLSFLFGTGRYGGSLLRRESVLRKRGCSGRSFEGATDLCGVCSSQLTNCWRNSQPTNCWCKSAIEPGGSSADSLGPCAWSVPGAHAGRLHSAHPTASTRCGNAPPTLPPCEFRPAAGR